MTMVTHQAVVTMTMEAVATMTMVTHQAVATMATATETKTAPALVLVHPVCRDHLDQECCSMLTKTNVLN
jgi:hypothetical protein